MTSGRNEYGKAFDERFAREYEANMKWPHSPDEKWNYRMMAIERYVAARYLNEAETTQEGKLQQLLLIMCHFLDSGAMFDDDERTLEDIWNEETQYPDPSYKFVQHSPEGQCGVTNFALAMVIAGSGIAKLEDIHYEEGSLSTDDGTLLDEHHAWLRITGKDGREWRLDLTSHQYADKYPDPDYFMRIVMQPNYDMEPHALINQPPLSLEEYFGAEYRDTKNSHCLVYNSKKSTPIKEYDVSQFKGRLERFIERSELNALGAWFGPANAEGKITMAMNTIWYPDSYNFRKESGSFEAQLQKDADVLSTNAVSYYDLHVDSQRLAEVNAFDGIEYALQANIAYIAMKSSELMDVDDALLDEKKETFATLARAAGNLLGRDSLGSLAYQALHIKQEGSKNTAK